MHLPAACQDESSPRSPLNVMCESVIDGRFEELPTYGAGLPSKRAGLDHAALLHAEVLQSSESQENTSMEKRQFERRLLIW